MDVTERKRAEAALHQTEKMAALGRLAAGIGHELNNLLAVIDGRVHLLDMQKDQPGAVARSVSSLRDASNRMKRIMAGLSNYAKPAKPELRVLPVHEFLHSAAELVAYQARNGNVVVSVDAPTELPDIRVERSEFMQILVNLATNAIEAMSEHGGGTLTLRGWAGSTGVHIEVMDTGPGIPRED